MYQVPLLRVVLEFVSPPNPVQTLFRVAAEVCSIFKVKLWSWKHGPPPWPNPGLLFMLTSLWWRNLNQSWWSSCCWSPCTCRVREWNRKPGWCHLELRDESSIIRVGEAVMETSKSCFTGYCMCMLYLYSGYVALRYSRYEYVRKCTCHTGLWSWRLQTLQGDLSVHRAPGSG